MPREENCADIDLKHNENEWREVDGEQWNWILRNSQTDFGVGMEKFRWLNVVLGIFEED